MLFPKVHSKNLVAGLVATSVLLSSVNVFAQEADIAADLNSKTKITYYGHTEVTNLKDLPEQTLKEKLIGTANGLLTVEMIRRLDQPARQLLRVAGLDGLLGKVFSLGAFYLTLDTIWKIFEKTPRIMAALPEARTEPRTEAAKAAQEKCAEEVRASLVAEFSKDPKVYAQKVRNIEVQNIEVDSEAYPKYNEGNDEFELKRDDMPRDHLQYIWKEITGFRRVNHINLKRQNAKITNGTLKLPVYTHMPAGTCRGPSRAELNAALNVKEKTGETYIEQLKDEAGHWINVSKVDCAATQEILGCGAIDISGAQISNIDCDARRSGIAGVAQLSKTQGYTVRADVKLGADLTTAKNQELKPISRVKAAECSAVQKAFEATSSEECEAMVEAANNGLVGISGYIPTNGRRGDPTRHFVGNRLAEVQLAASSLRELVGEAPYVKASCENNRLKFEVNPAEGSNTTTLPLDDRSSVKTEAKTFVPRITGSFGIH